MKLLVTILLFLSFKAQALPTRHEQIDSMTVNGSIWQLLSRLDFENGIHYTIEPKSSESDPRSNYDRLIMIPINVKPTFPALQNELTDYKAELHIIEDDRIAEVARIKDIRDRLKLLSHRNTSMHKHLGVPNPAAWLRDNINSMDPVIMEAHITAIEAEDLTQINLANTQKTKEDTRKEIKARINIADCDKLSIENPPIKKDEILKDMCLFLQGK